MSPDLWPRWQTLRRLVLAVQPRCPDPWGRHRTADPWAVDVAYILPVARYPEYALDLTNLYALCRPCWDTARGLGYVPTPDP